MTNPGPPGDADDPLARPDIGTGLPESGTQHATSTDFALPVDEPASASDPLTGDLPDGGSTAATPPPAQPAAPLYDEVASRTEAFEAIGDTGAAVYGDDPAMGGGGALGKVKAFAAQKPQLFLGAALAVGFVLGRLFSSSDDDEDD
jgi:hypothetical protein